LQIQLRNLFIYILFYYVVKWSTARPNHRLARWSLWWCLGINKGNRSETNAFRTRTHLYWQNAIIYFCCCSKEN